MGNRNAQINKLRSAIQAYKVRKQINDEFENPQEHLESMSDQQSVWTEEHIAETVRRINAQTDKDAPRKAKLRKWIKAHKILLAITSSITILALLAIAIESIICSVQAKP